MNEMIQIITAFCGSFGFGVLYNIHGKKLVLSALGGMSGWIVYLLVMNLYDDKILSLFAATMSIGILSELLARLMKCPATLFLIPMLIPLVPGSDLFYATSHLILNDLEEFQFFLALVSKEAMAIAFGIILTGCIVQIFQRVKQKAHAKHI